MTNLLELPPDWETIRPGWRLIDEGEYLVDVDEVIENSGDRVTVAFKVLDEGEFSGWTLRETFSLKHEVGKRIFKEFLNVIGLGQSPGTIDLDLVKRRVLRVVIKQKDDKDGKTWANITAHKPDAH